MALICIYIYIYICVAYHGCNFPLGAIRTMRPGRAPVPADVTGQEGTDWLQLLWNFVTSLVAPDEAAEGIHQLTETLTRKGASPHHCSPFNKDQDKLDAYPVPLALATFILHDRNIKM